MAPSKIVAVCSMYGCPLHQGHIDYLRLAREFVGDSGSLIVILNSDAQAVQKRGICAVPMKDRKAILQACRYVDEVVESIDADRTVCATLEALCTREGPLPTYFCNSGDRSSDEVPEGRVCAKYGVRMVDLPAPKVQSSSDMIRHILDNQDRLRW